MLFLGDAESSAFAKTAFGLAYWRPEVCLGQLSLSGSGADVGLIEMTVQEAVDKGAKTMVIGIANVGGFISNAWIPSILEALERGLDVASGLHARLADIEEVAAAARRHGRQLHDVRHPTESFKPGIGDDRSGKRVLMVGTDCDVGKMFTGLAIEREMRRRGVDVDFRATGQTGILIAGEGVSIDAVVADFVSGAAESLSPENHNDHWDVIEGQGCLQHPAYAAVTLGLIHGSQPDAIVLCHAADRHVLYGFPNYPTVPFERCIEENLAAARLTNAAVECVGLSVNTSMLDDEERIEYLARQSEELGLPCVDPLATGVETLVDRLEQMSQR